MDNELRQLRDQYSEGYDFLSARKIRQVAQLGLMNNLQRGDQNISSTTLFSLFNRVHSSLYSDVITVKFIPPEDSDNKKTETLNKLQQNDYREMEKWKLDYDWIWNTAFYGDGFCETIKWDKKRKMLVPEIVNPLMMIYDPYFAEPDEWRYYGKWITKSAVQLKEMAKAGLLEKDFNLDALPSGFDPDIWAYKSIHDAARMGTPVPDDTSNKNNKIYQIHEQFTYDDDGNKTAFWTDKNFSKKIYKKKIDWEEGWPIVRKQVFREPNSSISISVPDLLEDKHRAKSVLYNLMYMAAKDEANPSYLYNPDLVKDVSVFFQRQIEQHIPVEDIERAVKKLNLGPAVSNSLLQFVGILNNESTDAIGSTMVQPVMPRGKKSATESALAQQIADLTAALQSKILGIGEKQFWSHWYNQHLKHMKQADEKIITLTSVSGVSFEKIKLDDIKTKYPPKIEILSQREADYKELVKRRDTMQIYPEIVKQMTPKEIDNFNKFVFFPQFIKDSSTIDRIIPKSMDEIKAEQENDILEKDELANIDPQDDDEIHMYIHYMAKRTSATWAHILSHEYQLSQKKQKQNEQPPPQQGATKIKNNTENNAEAAAPLGQEMGDDLARGMARTR